MILFRLLFFPIFLFASIPDEVLRGIERHIETNSWPSIYYDVLPKIIRQKGYQNIVEIGVALGGHAETLLQNTEIKTYFGIDPYLYAYDPNDGFSKDVESYSGLKGQENFDYLYKWVKEVRLKPFEERCCLLREFSTVAADAFPDESIDCIFVDGDHRYEAVIADLSAWLPKLKTGCLMIGDDYWMEPVADAVNHFFSSQNKTVFFLTSNSGYKLWAVYK